MSKTVEQQTAKKIEFKTSWSEVTLQQFINIGRIQGNEELNDLRLQQRIRIIAEISSATYEELCKIPSSQLGQIMELTSFVDREPPKVNRKKPFKIEGKEFIFHPDFKNLTTGEMISVEQLLMDSNQKGTNATAEILALLIRPTKVIPSDDGGTKTVIEEFNAETWLERKEFFLKHLTTDKFYHELAFFLKKGSNNAISTLLSSSEPKK